MLLNKKKSGIVVFAARKRQNIPMMKKTKHVKVNGKSRKGKLIPSRGCIEGVPICEKYKYLGTILTPKLGCGEQISFIKRKSGYLLVKLYPYLKNASADARKDMWQTMVKPLFNAALVLLNYEPSETQKENLERTWRGTFKQFMMLNKAAPTELINKMINCDLRQLASNLVEECKIQWEDRKNFQALKPKKKLQKKINLLRGVSNKWCEIINFQSRLCLKCTASKEICTSLHLKNKHGIHIKDVLKIWEEDICPLTSKICESKKVPRGIIMDEVVEALEPYIIEMQNAKAQLSNMKD